MTKITLRKDSEWAQIDSELILVNKFSPLSESKVVNGKAIAPNKNVPYAVLEIESRKLNGGVTAYCTHSIDFINLWAIFEERTVGEDEEVLLLWSKKHYTNFMSKMMSLASPKMRLMVCRKGTYQEWAETWPELLSERKDKAWRAAASILEARVEKKPEVIK